jgi:hypothetical protein
VDEREWQRDDFGILLQVVRKLRLHRLVAGKRKLRLLAVACCQTVERYYRDDPESVARVELAEQVADGHLKATALPPDPHVGATLINPADFARQATVSAVATNAHTAAIFAGHHAALTQREVTAGDRDYALNRAYRVNMFLLRDIFGNPFRPVVFEPPWITSDVSAMAKGIYFDRAFDRLPILADALQEAGCDSTEILTHCRNTNLLHARGCWVIDSILALV